MASFIQSTPSTNGTTHPALAGGLIRSEEWGIDNTLDNFIIQNEQINCEVITDTTQDQKGAVVSQLDYDKHWTLTCDLIGDASAGAGLSDNVGDYTFYYDGESWKIQSCTYTGTYNDKKKWSLTAERWINFPGAQG